MNILFPLYCCLALCTLNFTLISCRASNEDPLVKQGRTAYQTQCATCHAADPSVDGPIGPAVKGSSKELIEARVLHATYPPDYQPKRLTHVMVPMPHLKNEIEALAAYLNQPQPLPSKN